jgi:hypothetical protein
MTKAIVPFAPTALYQTPLVDPKTGLTTWGWNQHFQAAAQQLAAPVSTAVPASSSAPAQVFQNSVPIASDGEFLYVATGPKTWKRIPLSSF